MKLGSKKIVMGLAGLAVASGVYLFFHLLVSDHFAFGYNIGYEPDQPIPFSHEKHSGQYKIDCKYCHTSADSSRQASVPSLNICMNCHLTVKTTSPYIQQITKAYNEGRPIEWQRVHLLPDHVKFNHAAHVQAGKTCQECHGPVEQMSRVYQFKSLSMGWCINCHRQPENKAPINCSTCHY